MGEVRTEMNARTGMLLVAVVLITSGSLFIGPRFIDPFHMDPVAAQVLFSIRMPRVVISLLMGTALGASGAVLQGILRNPLADPYILGISSGAGLMAALGLLLGAYFLGHLTVPALAFSGALLTGVAVGAIGYRRGGLWPERLLLAGIGISFLCSALLTLIMGISSNEGMRRAVLWISGDLSLADWSVVPYGAALTGLGLALVLWRSRALNALMLGDEIAYSLGFSPVRERLILFVAIGLMTASSVSMGGMVGFVGLLMPHVVRFFTGADARLLVPVAGLSGGALLCVADAAGRTLFAPVELPAGVITAIIGAPYFLFLLRRRGVLSI